MKRKLFLELLETVSGALADKDVTPALTHIWFTGTHILAYNFQIAISVKHKSGMTGGVPRSVIDLVKATPTTDVQFQSDEKKSMSIAFGNESKKSKEVIWRKPDTLAMLIQDSPFEMPKFETKDEFAVPDMPAFIKSLKSCMRSVTASIAAPHYLGVTLIAKGRTVKMYSTDNKSVSIEQASLKKDAPFKRIILSAPFCKQLIALSESEPVKLAINEEYSLATIGDKIMIFGNLVGEKEDPLDFEELVDQNIPADYAKHHVEVPQRLRQAIDRAVVITGADAQEAETTATVKDGFLNLESVSKALGKVSDKIKLSGKHPDIKITIQCAALQRDLDTFTRMYVTKTSWIMMNDTSIYLVAGV